MLVWNERRRHSGLNHFFNWAAQWKNNWFSLSVCGSDSISSRGGVSILRDYSWLITGAALYTELGRPKGRTIAETVVKNEMGCLWINPGSGLQCNSPHDHPLTSTELPNSVTLWLLHKEQPGGKDSAFHSHSLYWRRNNSHLIPPVSDCIIIWLCSVMWMRQFSWCKVSKRTWLCTNRVVIFAGKNPTSFGNLWHFHCQDRIAAEIGLVCLRVHHYGCIIGRLSSCACVPHCLLFGDY